MKGKAIGQDIPDRQENAPEDEQAPDLEQVAQNTSRKLLTLLAIGAILLLVIHTTPFGEQVRNWDSLAELFKAGGFQATVYFVLISSFLIMVGTPRLLFFALGGFAFGFWEGLLWSLCSSLIGSFLTFRAARWGGQAWLSERFGQRRFFGRIVHAKPTIASVALMRMLPVSNVIINVGLALSHVGDRAFLLGSLVGFLPQGVVAVIIGSGLAADVPWAGAVQLGSAGVLLLGIFFWTSRHRRKQT
ncbi:TVP38/TMEM64 family protein [Propionivibrio sp.]|uniref:TVP38/TMEM64 family protein n=1 Tax=Propionivibrio sp. TaxID=2212460 RepID=UPI003BF3A181